MQAQRAKALVRCRVGLDTYVNVTQLTSKQVVLTRSESIGLRWQEILLPRAASLIITVEFRVPMRWESTWCLYVELYIEAVIRAPGYRLLHPWDSTDM